MDRTPGKLPPTAELRSLESWRERVLRGMLTVGAIASPLVVLASILLRAAPYSLGRAVGLIVAGLAFPVLRFAPGLSVSVRAWLAIALCYAAGVDALATFGFSSGPGIVLVGTGLFATVLLGRGPALAMIAISVAAYFVVGELASRGDLAINGLELDPGQMRNWMRTGITFAGLAALLTSAIGYVIRHVERSSRAAIEAVTDVRLAYERLALVHDRLDAAKEEERRFVATELHDELGQILTVVKLRLRMPPGPSGGSEETVALVDQAIERVRKISRDLRPPLLDEVGLAPALRAHVEAQAALSGVRIGLETTESSGDRLPPGLEIACFRIVQESLTNALRHGGATRIDVHVNRGPSAIRLAIADDGRGFDTSKLEELGAGHIGVIGMQERVRARGGTLRVTSAPGAGTRVEVELPIEG